MDLSGFGTPDPLTDKI